MSLPSFYAEMNQRGLFPEAFSRVRKPTTYTIFITTYKRRKATFTSNPFPKIVISITINTIFSILTIKNRLFLIVRISQFFANRILGKNTIMNIFRMITL